ncbi:MAG: Asp-tRNA(Asn)/Glu-tRNA(Gln) amidotransferase GatCAB subunit A, partial [Pseudomonadales bacterium]|nr:Asp-tRNA(Asn)/Glu-tRNA(Gln) amidotransferase GatCAB subunit A [Pseudomonadales bacterium]
MAVHYQNALELAARIHRREISSVDATAHMLERIGDLDPILNAFVTVCADEAIKAAEASDSIIEKSGPRSPLDGVPIGVKDLLDTAGVETTYGMKIYRGYVPDEDATVVALLKEAGVVILGKLALTEGAYAR